MGHSGRHLLRTIIRTAIVVLLVINGFLYLSVAAAKREAVSGILPEPAASAQPALLPGWSGAYPRARVLRVSTITEESYGSDGRKAYQVAAFNPRDQAITLSSMFATLDAANQASTLRHEYGHALASDLIARDQGGDYVHSRLRTDALQLLTQTSDPRDLPPALKPLFEDYRSAPRSIYDAGAMAVPGYYTSTLGEFFAESFRRYLEGESIPSATRAVFERIEALQD